MAMTKEEIAAKIADVLVDALGVDKEEVKPESRLGEDLGAESIDFLDIVFRLEKAFTIDPTKPFKIQRDELFPEKLLTDPTFSTNGVVTPVGLEQMTAKLPHMDLTEFRKDPKVEKIRDLFTVETVVRFVQWKLEH